MCARVRSLLSNAADHRLVYTYEPADIAEVPEYPYVPVSAIKYPSVPLSARNYY